MFNRVAAIKMAAFVTWMLASVPLTGQLVAVVAVLLAVWYFCRSPFNIPPGPRGIPILGYLPFLGTKYPHITMDKLCKVHGPVMSLYFGSTLTVVLGDYPTLRKALQEMGDVFSGRPRILSYRLGKEIRQSVAFSEGPYWLEHKKFFLSSLRDFGFGKSSLEPMILNEIQCFLEEISHKKGEAFDITELMFRSTCNNICSLDFGKRFEYSDPKFQHLLRTTDVFLKEFDKTCPALFFPWVRMIPGIKKLIGLKTLRQTSSVVLKALLDLTKEHKLSYQPGSRADFTDAYMTEKALRQTQGNGSSFDDDALPMHLWILFIAGTETVTTTLMWSLLYMILHPDIQRKVQQEIDDVIGRERMPTMEDRLNMPYMNATIMEIQRRSTIGPLAIAHCTTEDVTFNGFHIPKGTFIFPNLWAVHNDYKLYPDPASFRPERFINQEGKAVKPEHLVTFGVGKRMCPGESLARMELFLYLTSMLQKFTFKTPEGAVLTTDAIGIKVEKPRPYKLCALSRNN